MCSAAAPRPAPAPAPPHRRQGFALLTPPGQRGRPESHHLHAFWPPAPRSRGQAAPGIPGFGKGRGGERTTGPPTALVGEV
eukprot:3937042-Rhodomonas_salina.1